MDADADGQNMLNIVYNMADVVNKTAFGLMVWYAATMNTTASRQRLSRQTHHGCRPSWGGAKTIASTIIILGYEII